MDALIDIAKGDAAADLLIKNAQVVNVFTGEILPANVAVAGEWIAGVGKEYEQGKETLDLEGSFLLPGLVNGHLHLESSLLSPQEYARFALAHGTTTIVLDPHEIANVIGIPGIEALMKSSAGLPLDFFFMAPSCVPATSLETSGAVLGPEEISKLMRNKRVLGLGEMMNFPGVLFQDPGVLEKIRISRAAGKCIDGHAPLLTGKDLNAYIAAGMESDHESTKREEAEEKLRKGMWLMIREGSAAKNMDALLPAVTPDNAGRCLFVLDDLEASDLIHQGEVDALLRKAVARGLNPVTAVRMATINAAGRFRLRDRGAIGPGRRADMAAVTDLQEFRNRLTIKNGNIVSRDGKTSPLKSKRFPPAVFRTVKIKPLNESSFDLHVAGEKAWAVGVIPDQILTRKISTAVKRDARGLVISDPENDTLKIAVVERHTASGRIGVGLVKNFGLKRGALATSVAHDSHNIVAVGATDEEMRRAVSEIEAMQGGFVVVDGGKVVRVPLPVAGLLSAEKAETLSSQMEILNRAAHEIGAVPQNPFLTLSFLALPVIPELKLTDRGLVDVAAFRIIPLEAD